MPPFEFFIEGALADRTVRSLIHLQNSASTARVLNLFRVARRAGKDPDYAARPFFTNPLLNSCIILKHRLRPAEGQLFDIPRSTATKIILPIDATDLRSGGRSVFVGEKSYDDVMRDVFGPGVVTGSRDRVMLDMLDALPSLDPFLLREQVKRNGLEVAGCYFDISEADLQNMFAYVQEQIQSLVTMSFGDGGAFTAQAAKLVKKILSGQGDNDLEPLRLTLKMAPEEYQEGLFCWKGFLYYSWILNQIYPKAARVGAELVVIRPRGVQNAETRGYIAGAKIRLSNSISVACERVRDTLNFYDNAYLGLTSRGDPAAFRDFLMAAPAMFNDLGERLGAIQHIVTFWQYRFPASERQLVSPDELVDILQDFEDGLAFEKA